MILTAHWLATAEPSQLLGAVLCGGGFAFFWFVMSNTNDFMNDL